MLWKHPNIHLRDHSAIDCPHSIRHYSSTTQSTISPNPKMPNQPNSLHRFHWPRLKIDVLDIRTCPHKTYHDPDSQSESSQRIATIIDYMNMRCNEALSDQPSPSTKDLFRSSLFYTRDQSNSVVKENKNDIAQQKKFQSLYLSIYAKQSHSIKWRDRLARWRGRLRSLVS